MSENCFTKRSNENKEAKIILPDFLLIGAAKSGTTSLHNYLRQHPEIYVPPQLKEPQFFLLWNNENQKKQYLKEGYPEFNEIDTVEKYSELFKGGRKFKCKGESSPQYLSYPGVAEKIFRLLPEVKLLVILRNPVERAYSQYLMMKRRNREKQIFETAIKEELKDGRIHLPFDQRYLQWGKYFEQLLPYYKFFPHHNIKIILYEYLKEDVNGLLKDVFKFLEVEENFLPADLKIYNSSSLNRFTKYPKIYKQLSRAERFFKRNNYRFLSWGVKKLTFYKPAFPKKMRAVLHNYYKEDILKLEQLILKDLSKWKK